jgi:hypothetical protein
VTRLGDERMLVSSGFELADIQSRAPGGEVGHHGTTTNRSIEVMLPGGGGMVVSQHGETPREIWNPDYTHVFQMPYGPADGVPANTILMLGDAGIPVWFLPDQPAGSRWMPISAARPGAPGMDAPNHGTASVLLPLRQPNGAWGYLNGSVLQAGGARGSTMERSISIFEISSTTWWNGDLGVRRRFPATVLLPDGKVMVVSGYDYNPVGENPFLRNAHYLDLGNPAMPFATGAAASGEIRGYHNVALLLPDGRVLIAGGRSRGSAQGDPEDEKPNFRYLHPPYLASGAPRPAIIAAPQTIGYGSTFTVGVAGGPVSEVVLMGLGSMTHAIDMNQRYVQLVATPDGARAVQVTGPANVQTAPPGYYMLFVLNQNRIPSVARFVRVAP